MDTNRLIPPLYLASSKAVAEDALKKAKINPGICYIEKENILAVIDPDNNIHYVGSEGSGGENADVSEIKNQLSAINTWVESHKTEFNIQKNAIEILNGDTDGSVKKTVADAIAKIIADSPESFDTLKEISDWISTHQNDVSGMNTQIQANKTLSEQNKTSIDAIKTDVDDQKAKLEEQKTEIGNLRTDLTNKITANTNAINTINGTGDGSIKKAVADAISSIVASAPESFNTLKEISDWISSHGNDASAMNTQITTNKNDIAALKTLIGQLPEGSGTTTLVAYIQKYVGDVIKGENLTQYAKTSDLDNYATKKELGGYAKSADLAESNERINAIEETISEESKFEVELLVNNWSSEYPFTQTVNIEGVMGDSDYVVIGVVHEDSETQDQAKASKKAFSYLMFSNNGIADGAITFKAIEKPETTFKVIVSGKLETAN